MLLRTALLAMPLYLAHHVVFGHSYYRTTIYFMGNESNTPIVINKLKPFFSLKVKIKYQLLINLVLRSNKSLFIAADNLWHKQMAVIVFFYQTSKECIRLHFIMKDYISALIHLFKLVLNKRNSKTS